MRGERRITIGSQELMINATKMLTMIRTMTTRMMSTTIDSTTLFFTLRRWRRRVGTSTAARTRAKVTEGRGDVRRGGSTYSILSN